MDLLLWRHAEAHEATHGMSDLERALTGKGEKQAQRVGKWLDRQLPESARIMVSPAQRTLQTAQALGRKFKVYDQLGPEQSAEALLALSGWPDAKGTVVVVGHQPSLGHTLSLLLDLKEPDFAFKKGAVWWLRHRQEEGKTATVVVTVQSPDFL
jgi:phosphohistidine phosphatase